MPVVYKNQGNTPVPPLFSLTVIQLRSRGHCRLSHAYGTGSTPSGTVGDIMATLWVERKVIIHCHFPPINGTYRSPFFFFFFHQPLFSNSTTLLTLLRPSKEGTNCFPYVTEHSRDITLAFVSGCLWFTLYLVLVHLS